MRIYLVLTIIAFAKAQGDMLSMPTGLQQDFGDADQHLEDLNQKINDKQKQDYENEKSRKITQFLQDSQRTLDEYVNVDNLAEHGVGKFKVHFQKKCQINMPELELPEQPHEVDCFSGGYDGKYLAEALTKITKDNLQNPEKAMGVLYDCELLMQQELTLTLYEKCFEGEFGQYYSQYFNEFVDKMKDKNFKYDPETNKFVYKTDKVLVDRETGETQLIPANQISL